MFMTKINVKYSREDNTFTANQYYIKTETAIKLSTVPFVRFRLIRGLSLRG